MGLVAGLTGGMACGKSFVARTLAAFGAIVIEADELGHAVLEPPGEIYESIVAEFGSGILDEQSRIDRSLLARRVFPDLAALERLNSIIHPAVRREALARVEQVFREHPGALIIYAAAILIESGGHEICEKIIVVSCKPEQQIERALHRDRTGRLTEAEIAARISRQMPLSEKLKWADYVIDSSGTKEDTARQTKLVYGDLSRLAAVSPDQLHRL